MPHTVCCMSTTSSIDVLRVRLHACRVARALAVLDSTASDIKSTFSELYARGEGPVLQSVEARGLQAGTATSTTGSR